MNESWLFVSFSPYYCIWKLYKSMLTLLKKVLSVWALPAIHFLIFLRSPSLVYKAQFWFVRDPLLFKWCIAPLRYAPLGYALYLEEPSCRFFGLFASPNWTSTNNWLTNLCMTIAIVKFSSFIYWDIRSKMLGQLLVGVRLLSWGERTTAMMM